MNTLIVLTCLFACSLAKPQYHPFAYNHHNGHPLVAHQAPQADSHPAITLAGHAVPEDTPAVQQAKAEFFARYNQEVATHAHEDHAADAHANHFAAYNAAPYQHGAYNNLGYNNFYSAPYAYGYNTFPHNNYLAAPYGAYNNHAFAAPYAHHGAAYAAEPAHHGVYAPGYSTQHASQDIHGAGSFGYSTPDQTHEQSRDAYGNVAGSYSYVDPTGKVVQTSYTADAVHGFRVASNALPVGPSAPHVDLAHGPLPVHDTPEVVAAKADFFRSYAEAEARAAH